MAYTTIDDPTIYFNTVIYTGNATARTITGVGFQPDWVWGKIRSESQDHVLVDSVRGATKQLYSSDSASEQTESQGLTGFASDGFTLGTHAYFNKNTATYVAWNWKAGTSASGNTTGSGTAQSYTASVSTTAGFSITVFTGNGNANHTLPHNLGVAPDWFIIKKKVGTGDSTVRDWNVFHKSLGNTKRIALNSTGTPSTSNEYWNDTSPTSSVINLGTNDQINGDNNTYVCYAFAEKKGYSKFGSYTGNGNADGTFVYTGFRPAFLIIKKSSATEDWGLIDNKRDPNNDGSSSQLFPNGNNVEDTSNDRADFLSNGFKLRTSSGQWNTSSGTYIYMAFAESPFVNSNGVPNNAR